jgi:hypothetical protein
LIKEGAEPRIAHLQRSVLQQEQQIADLLSLQRKIQLRLESLEQRAGGNE